MGQNFSSQSKGGDGGVAEQQQARGNDDPASVLR